VGDKPRILFLIPPSFLYPMGAAYVATALIEGGFDFDIYGFYYDGRAWLKSTVAGEGGAGPTQGIVRRVPARYAQEYLGELIARERYDYVLVGGLVGFFRWFYHILPQIKGYHPGAQIVMGGGITKDLPEDVLFEKLSVDYILKGEAETNIAALLSLLCRGPASLADLSRVPGLCWKDSSSAVRRNPTARFDLANGNVLPAWDSFDIEEYVKLSDTLFRYDMTFFPVMAGRGCPNVCAFCSPSVGRFAPRSVDSIIAEMRHFKERYRFDFFFIYSEIAFDSEEFAREFCLKYREAIAMPWVGQIRTDVKFSVDTYRLMKESGCLFICMGIESACERLLAVMNKHTSVADTMRNLGQAREAGLNVFGNFMFGHESETAEEIRETFDFVNKHDLISGPSNGLATLIIYPGTAYYRTGEKKGLVPDPFKYLLSYSLKAGISDVTIRDKLDSILNITALSDDDYFDVVCRENIRHRRLFSRRHRAVAVQRTFELGARPGFAYRGKCPVCGSPVSFGPEACRRPLEISALCRTCFYFVHLDTFEFTETVAHLADLSAAVERSTAIVVYGGWVMDLLFNAAIAIPHEKIVAWVDPDDPGVSQRAYFYHIPQLSSEGLRKRGYDLIVSLKPRLQSAPAMLQRHGLDPACRTVNVFPDALNPVLAAAFAGRRIAIVGSGETVRDAARLVETCRGVGTSDRLGNLGEVRAGDRRYDLVVYDRSEAGVDRCEFAQDCRYRVDEILYPAFLCDGGQYVPG
jgi:radical SAM superfamily enzyme YgiQ (UPF0313 family)